MPASLHSKSQSLRYRRRHLRLHISHLMAVYALETPSGPYLPKTLEHSHSETCTSVLIFSGKTQSNSPHTRISEADLGLFKQANNPRLTTSQFSHSYSTKRTKAEPGSLKTSELSTPCEDYGYSIHDHCGFPRNCSLCTKLD